MRDTKVVRSIVGTPPSRVGKRAFTVFISEEAYKEIRRIAYEQETTNQALGVAAINDMLLKYGAKPVA